MQTIHFYPFPSLFDNMKKINNPQKIVLKIGGSVITKPATADEFPLDTEEIKRQADKYIQLKEIKRLGSEIQEAMEERKIKLIIINGVGPFGHNLVKNREKLKGTPAEIIRQSVEHLNKRLIDILSRPGLRLKPIAPFYTCTFSRNRGFNVEKMWLVAKKSLNEGLMPSTYGDVVKAPAGDGDYGNYHVISGDDSAPILAKLWNADKIIMATDIDGVFTKDPKIHKDAKLIKNLGEGAKAEYTITRVDVTGGMSSKVKKLQLVAKDGIKSQIINGLKEGNVKAALLGDESIGTLILP